MNRNYWIGVVFLACSVGCGGNPVASDLVTPLRVDKAVVATLNGRTFAGSETAQVGEVGTLTATFVAEPTGANVFIKLRWHSDRLNVDYEGEVTGAMDALKIRATTNPGGGTLCGYEAGAVMPDADTITGNYGGTGPGPCSQKRGTFTLRAPAVPPPPLPRPPCESVNVPTFDHLMLTQTDPKLDIAASVHVANGATWKLVLYASTKPADYPDHPDFEKAIDPIVLACGQDHTLQVSYPWMGHPSPVWWASLYKDGVLSGSTPFATR